MLKRLFPIITLILLLCANSSFAQNDAYHITLNVTDENTHLPITGVTINLFPSDLKGNSDGAGLYKFTFSRQEAKTPVLVKYSAVGYHLHQQKILITKDTSILISLNPIVNKLQEVEIKSKQAATPRTSIATTLTEKQLEKTRGGTLAETLADISGVNMLKSGSTISKPIIHGLHSNRILILNNGIRLEGQQWGAEHAPEIDPFIAQQIHVIKGAESVKYGAEAIGGIVITEPPALPQTAAISGNVNLIGASNGRAVTTAAMLTGGLKAIKGFGWRLQGSAKKSGNIKTADYYLGNTGVRELNFSAAAGYQTGKSNYEAYYSRFSTELGILYSAHIGTIEDINARIEAGRPLESYNFSYNITAPRQKISHQLLKLTGHYDLDNHHKLDITYAFQKNQRKEYDIRRGDREAIPITDLVLSTHTLDLKLDVPLAHGAKRSYGINSMMQVNNNIPGTLANTFIPNFDSYTAGLFIIQHWIKEKYELEAGLRYDYKYFDAAGFRYSQTTAQEQQNENTEQYYGGNNSFNNVTGSAGILWKFNTRWHLASNIGLAWRAPTANELYSNGLHHGAGLFEVGNPAMQNEKGYKWITSLKHSGNLLKFNLDVYLQYISNYIYSRPDRSFKQTISGTYPIFRYTQTNATFAGIDFTGSYQFLPAFSYQLNASLIRAKDIKAKNYLPYIPADRISQAINWNLDLKGSYLQFKHSFIRRQTRFEAESDYAPPPGAYHLFTMTAGTSIKLGQQSMSINMSADNLFNTLYKDYMNRYRYYTHEMGRNLTLRLAYKF
ncbi:iron complex outermembrane receptor protein [Pedobacter cryoconitis]|uniref:Iron complex outermembrane receptor protein n=1 Tax=Pedobacter cryoconitis TaxID=188932 RepID=A0A7W8ZRV0_9SPHI|nr:TonB-dependent receptor [Pedobacter cryoconitis]MBB5638895.1 iron complex outermembrane receptor protein [Pedobacter cryoconitis]